MISLITGLPGSGKTSLMVHMLMTRSDLKNRPLYVDGIPELKIPTQPIPEGESMATWHLWAPTGAVLVIDEAQRIFRPRPAGAKVPDYVQELETHRHKGLDIFVLTQHPRLIDVNLRSLIGEHRNISKTLLGVKRISYWRRCANPESRADIAEAKNSIFFTKKDAFGMYKSAEEHNKLRMNTSAVVWILPIVVAITSYLIYDQKKNWERKMGETQKTAEISQPIDPQIASMPEFPQDTYSGAAPAVSDSMQPLKASDFEPGIEGKPWTAPIYSSLNRNIQTMPYPVACVENQNKCTCYTDQATPIKGMDKAQCLDFVENGIYNPYLATEYDNTAQSHQSSFHEESPTVAQMGGKALPSLHQGDSVKMAVIQ